MTEKKPLTLTEAAMRNFENAKLPDFIDRSNTRNPYAAHTVFGDIKFVSNPHIPDNVALVMGVDFGKDDATIVQGAIIDGSFHIYGEAQARASGRFTTSGIFDSWKVDHEALAKMMREAGEVQPKEQSMVFKDEDFTHIPELEDKSK